MSHPNKKRLRRSMMFLNCQKPGLIKDPYIYKPDSIMLDLEDAVDLAVNECIEQGILAEFLRKHRAEAMEMGALDFDEWEKYKLRKADFEAGQEVATTKNIEILMEKQGLSLEEACELLDFEVKLYHETKKLMEEDELYGS